VWLLNHGRLTRGSSLARLARTPKREMTSGMGIVKRATTMRAHPLPSFFLLVSLSFAAAGCMSSSGGSSGSGSSSGGSRAATDLNRQARVDLAACRGGTSDDAFDDALEITHSFRDSCHELVVCGGLTVSLVGAVMELFVNAALGKSGDDGLKFDGEGRYVSAPGSVSGTSMEVTLHSPKDTSFGRAGELIPYDLLAVGSYFVGAKVRAETSAGSNGITVKVKVSYQALGPAFELLGMTAPEGPGEVTLDSKEIVPALGAIKLRAIVRVDDEKGRSRFRYEMAVPETTLGAVFDGGPVGFTLDDVEGGRADLAQELTTTRWDVQYVDGAIGALDGTIGFSIAGGPLPYDVTFSYPRAADPIVKVACP
jgi:hypothetical protein